MIKRIYIIGILLFAHFSHAQFMGGSDDGTNRSILHGSRLSGEIASFSVLYQGNAGDGFDTRKAQLVLSNSNVNIYAGSLGDGFSQKTAVVTISGDNINSLYAGNIGDGFYSKALQSILSGEDTSVVFGGSIGDGADNELSLGLLLEGFMTMLFKGGDGDGFAYAFKPDNYLTGIMLTLFNGGIGDGFAINNFTSALTLDLVEKLIEMELLLYPNPASHVVTLKSDNNLEITKIQLFDVAGKELKVNLSKNNTINVNALPDGIYLLNIYATNGNISKKLIVKK
ncbi:T9SS type A sorting domain-containing protein [Hyunsoonleella sp. SJ7]|uniref:T9SS type A sorting domain-containing protein n=1 Tax=Hyunsoonleella aquatilis TaxID=2762758 RepID=A0A923HBM2_9FLAO|nr:T9SS type A sorting domain-containing protein [Hyunsoonleella aquatilis]MBC3759514.1 T9SS type A sorting domain-containing protein [Hyunsoonleella aquatilis]